MMIKDTLYAKYLKERQNADILENEHSFLIYNITGSECFIIDLSVGEDQRRNGHCRSLIEDLSKLALDAGAEFISGNIFLKDPNHKTTLMAAIRIGFDIARAEDGILTIVKKIGGHNG